MSVHALCLIARGRVLALLQCVIPCGRAPYATEMEWLAVASTRCKGLSANIAWSSLSPIIYDWHVLSSVVDVYSGGAGEADEPLTSGADDKPVAASTRSRPLPKFRIVPFESLAPINKVDFARVASLVDMKMEVRRSSYAALQHCEVDKHIAAPYTSVLPASCCEVVFRLTTSPRLVRLQHQFACALRGVSRST